jgi:hypothetical protein
MPEKSQPRLVLLAVRNSSRACCEYDSSTIGQATEHARPFQMARGAQAGLRAAGRLQLHEHPRPRCQADPRGRSEDTAEGQAAPEGLQGREVGTTPAPALHDRARQPPAASRAAGADRQAQTGDQCAGTPVLGAAGCAALKGVIAPVGLVLVVSTDPSCWRTPFLMTPM